MDVRLVPVVGEIFFYFMPSMQHLTYAFGHRKPASVADSTSPQPSSEAVELDASEAMLSTAVATKEVPAPVTVSSVPAPVPAPVSNNTGSILSAITTATAGAVPAVTPAASEAGSPNLPLLSPSQLELCQPTVTPSLPHHVLVPPSLCSREMPLFFLQPKNGTDHLPCQLSLWTLFLFNLPISVSACLPRPPLKRRLVPGLNRALPIRRRPPGHGVLAPKILLLSSRLLPDCLPS